MEKTTLQVWDYGGEIGNLYPLRRDWYIVVDIVKPDERGRVTLHLNPISNEEVEKLERVCPHNHSYYLNTITGKGRCNLCWDDEEEDKEAVDMVTDT